MRYFCSVLYRFQKYDCNKVNSWNDEILSFPVKILLLIIFNGLISKTLLLSFCPSYKQLFLLMDSTRGMRLVEYGEIRV